jgi:hypothetical protein
MMEAPDALTTRDEIADVQAQRLPQLATRLLLHPHPRDAMEEAVINDALELAAAEVVESGREFMELNDEERQKILVRNYTYCLQRNTTYLRKLEDRK